MRLIEARGGYGCAGPQAGGCCVTILTPQHACRPERCAGRFLVERSKLYLEEERPEDKRREGRDQRQCGAWCMVWPDWRLLARVLLAGWDEKGIYIFEGGCYAKTTNLS